MHRVARMGATPTSRLARKLASRISGRGFTGRVRQSGASEASTSTGTSGGTTSQTMVESEPAGAFKTGYIDPTFNTLDLTATDLARSFQLLEDELEVVRELEHSMKECGVAFGAVGVASFALLLFEVLEGHTEEAADVFFFFKGVTVGDVAPGLDSLLMAFLLTWAAGSFNRVLATEHKETQLAFIFQGINRLGLIFQQLGVAAIGVGFVMTMEAAETWPPIISIASASFFIFAAVRCWAMWFVVNRYAQRLDDVETSVTAFRHCKEKVLSDDMPLLDRLAIAISFNYLMQFLSPSMSRTLNQVTGEEAEDGELEKYVGHKEYEFNSAQNALLNSCINAANQAGAMLLLQAYSTILLVSSSAAVGEYADAASDSINVVNKVAAATLIYVSSVRFDLAVHTEGNDVGHMLYGLGKCGFTSLFENLRVLAWAVALAHLAAAAAPMLEESPLSSFLTDKISHRVVEAVVEHL